MRLPIWEPKFGGQLRQGVQKFLYELSGSFNGLFEVKLR